MCDVNCLLFNHGRHLTIGGSVKDRGRRLEISIPSSVCRTVPGISLSGPWFLHSTKPELALSIRVSKPALQLLHGENNAQFNDGLGGFRIMNQEKYVLCLY